MFDKSKKNIKKIDLQIGKLHRKDDILLSSSLIEMVNDKNYYKQIGEKNDYQDRVTSYINKKHEYDVKKQYNPKIITLYHDGIIVIDNTQYKLKDFFIVFDSKLNNFHLKCIDQNFKTKEIKYNKAVRFIDTTAFINLVNNEKIINDKIILDDIKNLNDVVSNWDGYLHSDVVETDAIINKKMIKDDKNE